MLKVFKKINKNWLYFWSVFFLILALDQISKILILNFFPDIVFRSFGLFGHFNLLWIGFFVIILVLFFIFFRKVFFQKKITILLFGAILGAAASNVLDKISRAVVLDWIPIFGLRFNLADLTIIICGITLALYLWRED